MEGIGKFLITLAAIILISALGMAGPVYILTLHSKKEIHQFVNTFYPNIAFLVLALIILGITFIGIKERFSIKKGGKDEKN